MHLDITPNTVNAILAGTCLLGIIICDALLTTKRHNKNITLFCLCALPAFTLAGIIFAVAGFDHIG